MKLSRIVAIASVLLPSMVVASPVTVMPLPAAARQAILAAREAKTHAMAAYRLACRQADRKEFLALKLAEKSAMKAGNLKAAEAAELHAKHVQARFADGDRFEGKIWTKSGGGKILFATNHQVRQTNAPGMVGYWYRIEGLSGFYVVLYNRNTAIDLIHRFGGNRFIDFNAKLGGAWIGTRTK